MGNKKSGNPVDAAVKILKDTAKGRKFDETIDVAVNLGVDTKQADQNIRGMLVLPHGTGKSVRVAVMARGAKAEEAKKAGADVVGAGATSGVSAGTANRVASAVGEAGRWICPAERQAVERVQRQRDPGDCTLDEIRVRVGQYAL